MSADTAEPPGYDVDFFEWTQRQAELLRREAELRSNAPLDWLNPAEEIESSGLRDRREVEERDIPSECPFSAKQVLDPRFWPPRERAP